jgi:NTE family protein
LRRLVEKHVIADRIEDAALPLHGVTADVVTGDEVLLSRGPLVDAVLASAAIPGVFPPVAWDGRLLVDGGIVNHAPISHAVELGADRVIVLPAIAPVLLSAAPRGALAAGVTAVARTIARRLTDDIALYSRHVDLTVLPSPSFEGILPTDFGHADELVEQAFWSARSALASPRRPQLAEAA